MPFYRSTNDSRSGPISLMYRARVTPYLEYGIMDLRGGENMESLLVVALMFGLLWLTKNVLWKAIDFLRDIFGRR
jgi:hypothetical protein